MWAQEVYSTCPQKQLNHAREAKRNMGLEPWKHTPDPTKADPAAFTERYMPIRTLPKKIKNAKNRTKRRKRIPQWLS